MGVHYTITMAPIASTLSGTGCPITSTTLIEVKTDEVTSSDVTLQGTSQPYLDINLASTSSLFVYKFKVRYHVDNSGSPFTLDSDVFTLSVKCVESQVTLLASSLITTVNLDVNGLVSTYDFPDFTCLPAVCCTGGVSYT